MTDINAIVQGSLQQMFDSGKVNEMIEKQLENTVGEIIRSTLREYSDFGKALRQAIEGQLPTKFDEVRLVEYNHFIIAAVQRRLHSLLHDEYEAELNKMMDAMLGREINGPLKMSDLAKRIRDEFKSDDPCSCGSDDNFTFLHETSDYGGGWIYFDQSERKSKYECQYQLGYINDGEVFSVKVNGNDPKKDLFMGPHYGIERLLMTLYFRKATLEIDCDASDIDTSLVDYD